MRLLNLNDYVRLALSHAMFSPNDDGSWTAEITVLPGCVTWGETRPEAALMAEDAVQGWLVTALRFGNQIPEIDGFALSHLSDPEDKAELIYA
ncbi:MAG: type II toxin-antitoxin system HicB family antitoxin [Anaerolineae bacterium]